MLVNTMCLSEVKRFLPADFLEVKVDMIKQHATFGVMRHKLFSSCIVSPFMSSIPTSMLYYNYCTSL